MNRLNGRATNIKIKLAKKAIGNTDSTICGVEIRPKIKKMAISVISLNGSMISLTHSGETSSLLYLLLPRKTPVTKAEMKPAWPAREPTP